jgi:hypothetical protein
MRELKATFTMLDLSSRGRRRKVVPVVVGLLERIRAEEQMLLVRMPLNLQGSDAYDVADHYIGMLDDAIDVVDSVYD